MRLIEEAAAKVPNKDLEGGAETHLLMEENEASQDQLVAGFSSTKSINEGTDSLPVSCFFSLELFVIYLQQGQFARWMCNT